MRFRRTPGRARTRVLLLFLASFLLASFLVPGVAPPALGRSDVVSSDPSSRGPAALYAIRAPYLFSHSVGLITCQITNMGIAGNPFVNELISFEWRGDEYLYAASLWIGATPEGGTPHVSTGIPTELRPDLSLVDTIYPSYEGISGGARAGTPGSDDDDDGAIDEDFHNGKDDDGDGQIDEDFAAIGDEMLSCEYRDNTPEAIEQMTDHVPLGIKVRQRSFAWSAASFNEFVGFDFTVINIGDQHLRNVYAGLYIDADVGPKTASSYWTDDLARYVHVDTTLVTGSGECDSERLVLDIASFFDVPDNGSTVAGGDAAGHLGAMFLGHPTDPGGISAPTDVGARTVRFFTSSGSYPQGQPRTDVDRYHAMSEGGTSAPAPFLPDDYQGLVSVGPFARLDPGEAMSFQVALVVGEGRSGLIQNALNAQRLFRGTWYDADGDPLTGVDGREACLRGLPPGDVILWDDPCDTLSTTVPVPDVECFWVDADCNACTGVNGAEAPLHWIVPDGSVPVVFLELSASVQNGGILISFRIDPDARPAGAAVERRTPGGNWALNGSERVRISSNGWGEMLDKSPEPGQRYEYRIILYMVDGSLLRSGALEVLYLHEAGEPHARLLAPFPNPSSHEVWLPFEIVGQSPVEAGFLSMRILDAAGHLIRNLGRIPPSSGSGSLVWDRRDQGGTPVAAGIYFVVLDGRGSRSTQKIVLRR